MTVDSLVEEVAERPKTQQGAKDGAYAGQGGSTSSVVRGAYVRLWGGHVLAEGADKVHLGALIDLLLELLKRVTFLINNMFYIIFFIAATHLIEQNGGHAGQWLLQPLGGLARLAQQKTALGGVGTGLDVFPAVNVVLLSTPLAGIDIVREVLTGLHQAVDEVDRQSLARVLHLVGVGLDVLDGTGVHLVAIALIRPVVAGEGHLGALGEELRRGTMQMSPLFSRRVKCCKRLAD